MSRGPSRSERNAANLPSGERAASASAPSKLVSLVNFAFSSGLSMEDDVPRGLTHQAAPAATKTAAAAAQTLLRLGAAAVPPRWLGSDFVSQALWKRRRSSARSPAC